MVCVRACVCCWLCVCVRAWVPFLLSWYKNWIGTSVATSDDFTLFFIIILVFYVCVRARVRACVRAYVRACARTCVRAPACLCVARARLYRSVFHIPSLTYGNLYFHQCNKCSIQMYYFSNLLLLASCWQTTNPVRLACSCRLKSKKTLSSTSVSYSNRTLFFVSYCIKWSYGI